MPYHELLTEPSASLVGAEPHEVAVMGSLTANPHLMMVSFYRPTVERHKVLIEDRAFPSDRYAVESQIRFHGLELGDRPSRSPDPLRCPNPAKAKGAASL